MHLTFKIRKDLLCRPFYSAETELKSDTTGCLKEKIILGHSIKLKLIPAEIRLIIKINKLQELILSLTYIYELKVAKINS